MGDSKIASSMDQNDGSMAGADARDRYDSGILEVAVGDVEGSESSGSGKGCSEL